MLSDDQHGSRGDARRLVCGAEWTAADAERIGALADRLADVAWMPTRYCSERDRDAGLRWAHATFWPYLSEADFRASQLAICFRLEQAARGMLERAKVGHWSYSRPDHDYLVRITRAELYRLRKQREAAHV